MSNTPPIDYQALPWARIREQYEKTAISLRMLARQWGLGSKNVIQRKIKAEGWVRRLGNIASHLALAQVAALEPDHELPIPRLPPRGRNGNGRDHPQKVAADTLRDEADVVTILTARTLAQMQTKRILRQLKVAEDIQEAGLSIVRCLIEVLKGDEAKVPQALERLLGVAPAGETMAGLLKAAAEAIDRGVVMERRALGMDW